MKFEPVPLPEAKGKILGHNIAGANGRRLLRKGKPLTDQDLENLRALGRTSVYVARLEEDDVDENTAARRVAQAVGGPGIYIPGVSAGRANFLANEAGLLRVDEERLRRLNECSGITLATLLTHSPVHAKQLVATVKIIPYAVPESILSTAEAIAAESRQLVHVDALPVRSVGMILSGSASMYQRLVADFAPLRDRVERLGSYLTRTDLVALDDESDEAALADMLKQQLAAG
ncbi:MAG TPA: hypothetical protein VK249_33625, partial [Anaerolineales bacterium]|nr:hypothetical protein [Anaerolineales bacterium]